MLNIRSAAMAEDAGRITLADADVVKHGRCLNEVAVKPQLWMPVANQQRLISN